ncbi:sulfotransferase [Candidatus Kuenenia sp.]|uniref:sulfotransferase n=1 Tax=Candidatus Kuenenia sp. TaxID=2499824 RepID=UPI00321FA320
MSPDFLCIGAQKSGTTWIYRNLNKHPDVWLPPIKEIHYFDKYQDKANLSSAIFSQIWRRQLKIRIRKRYGFRDFKNLKWDFTFFFRNHTPEWYLSLFEPGGSKKTGDFTPGYATLPSRQVAFIEKLIPNVKIIFLLRNPIYRAWSQIRMEVRKQSLNINDHDAVLKKIDSNKVRLRGDYLRTLDNWRSYYQKGQMFIGFFEQVISCQKELLLQIYQFLEINDSPEMIPNTIHHNYNPGIKVHIPPKIAGHLAKIYYEDIKKLNSMFGGYTDKWLAHTEEILQRSP